MFVVQVTTALVVVILLVAIFEMMGALAVLQFCVLGVTV
jgi:hypothetical protein